MSSKRSRSTRKKPSAPSLSPPVARAGGAVLRSEAVGALPIVNDLLCRIRLEEFLRDALPKEDRRTKLSPAKALLVLLRNLLVSREPIYGLGEWAIRYAPDLLGLGEKEISLLNDDRVGRALDKLFAADVASLVLRVAAHVVKEFGLRLDELHNDSTTVSFFGAYLGAALEQQVFGRPTLAITFGHSKDHRPDLKQLLFILTVTADGGVPLHFRAASGNVSDDTTHRDTWDLLCQLTGRRDFLYVADSKLATRENMAYIHQRQGRFITVLPKTRSEDAAFRELVRTGQVHWRLLWEKTDEEGEVLDRYSTSDQAATSTEGYRLVWYHSRRKAEQDAMTRAARIERALKELAVAARQALLAADPLPRSGQGGRGGRRDPRLVRRRRLDRHRDPTAGGGDLSPGTPRTPHQRNALREEGDLAFRPHVPHRLRPNGRRRQERWRLPADYQRHRPLGAGTA